MTKEAAQLRLRHRHRRPCGNGKDHAGETTTPWISVLARGLAAALVSLALTPSIAIAQSDAVGESGLALPRFVSLKAQPINLRKGPGTQYPIAWVFRRAGLPLEILREYEQWREVRDADGTTGWILGSLLSGRRTAIVQPWQKTSDRAQRGFVALREARSETADIVAQIEPGTIVSLRSCDGRWCAVGVSSFRGHIRQRELWGVYAGEELQP